MEKINYCRVELFKDMEVGSKDIMCFVFEFDCDEDLKKVSENFLQGLIFKVPIPGLKEHFNQFWGWNADYYSSLAPYTPTLIILSECNFVFTTEEFHFKGRVEKENLELLGFKSLLDLEEKKYQYKLLLLAKDLVVSSPNEVYMRSFYSIKNNIENIF